MITLVDTNIIQLNIFVPAAIETLGPIDIVWFLVSKIIMIKANGGKARHTRVLK